MLVVNKNTICWLLTSWTSGQERLPCVEMQLHGPLPLSEIPLDTIHRKSWRCLNSEIDDFYPLISGVHLKMTVEDENDKTVDIGQLLETSKHV